MSELQKILKTLLAFFRQVNGDPWTAEEGTLHLEMIEQMQKEFKVAFCGLEINEAKYFQLRG